MAISSAALYLDTNVLTALASGSALADRTRPAEADQEASRLRLVEAVRYLSLAQPEVVTLTYRRPARSLPLRTRQDLVLSAVIIVYESIAFVCLTTEPFPESLVEPLGAALGLLAWTYERQR